MRTDFEKYATQTNIWMVLAEAYDSPPLSLSVWPRTDIPFWKIHILENNSILKREFTGLPRLNSKKFNLYLQLSYVSGAKQKFKIDNQLSMNMPKKIMEYLNKNTHKFNHLMNSLPNMCEGDKTILDVAEFVGLPFRLVENYVNMWVEKKLIKKVWIHPFKKRAKKSISI